VVDACVPIREDSDVVAARSAGRSVAEHGGFGGSDITMIATAISELARNILKYAREGEIVVEGVQQNGRAGVSVIARDEGPGIADVGQAMTDGFSTGAGLGHGLGGTRRLVDEFDLDTAPGRGTTVTVVRWKP